MSYILEALKKSEKERKQETIPGIESDHSMPGSRKDLRRHPRLLAFVLLPLLFIGAVWLGWWFFPTPEVIMVPRKLPAKTEVVKEEEAADQVPVLGEPGTEAEYSSLKKEIAADGQGASLATPVGEAEAAPLHASEGGDESRILPYFEDLPQTTRDDLPELSFAGHVYAEERGQRMIMINQRILREGDVISPALVLDEIETNGVILRYRDLSFRVNLF